MTLALAFAVALFGAVAGLTLLALSWHHRVLRQQDRLTERLEHLGAELTRLDHAVRQTRTLVDRLCDLHALDERLDIIPDWRAP